MMGLKAIEPNFLKVHEEPPLWTWGRYSIEIGDVPPFKGRYILLWNDVMTGDDLFIADFDTFDQAVDQARREWQ